MEENAPGRCSGHWPCPDPAMGWNPWVLTRLLAREEKRKNPILPLHPLRATLVRPASPNTPEIPPNPPQIPCEKLLSHPPEVL